MGTLYRLLRAGMHSILLFVMPWLVGTIVGMVVDVREVSETGSQFATFFGFVVIPLLFLQLVAIAVKVGREIRSMRPDVRVVLSTGYAPADGARDLPVDAVLPKPYSASDLARTVDGLLESPPTEPAPA